MNSGGRERNIYADDLVLGQVFVLGTYTVTEAELLDFARQWDPQWFHVDKAAAQDGVFGGLIASGLHTLAICQKLTVSQIYDRWNVIAGKSLRDVKFLRPVRPGDTLTGTVTIDDVLFDSRARGLVTTTTELRDTQGNRVLVVVTEAYVHTRNAGTLPE